MSDVKISDELLSDLEAKAREATPGPWHAGKTSYRAIMSVLPGGVPTLIGQAWSADADFIAVACPRTALALVAEVRRLRLELATRAVFAPEGKPTCCPVCGGRGMVPSHFYETNMLTLTVGDVTCRCCAGAGYIR